MNVDVFIIAIGLLGFLVAIVNLIGILIVGGGDTTNITTYG